MNDFVLRITEDLLFRAAADGTPRVVLRIAADLLFRAAARKTSSALLHRLPQNCFKTRLPPQHYVNIKPCRICGMQHLTSIEAKATTAVSE